MRTILLISSCALLASCLGYKELPVEYDYSYRGNFKRYRSFEMIHAVGSDTSMLNQVVEKSIISRMKFLGYRQVNHRPQRCIREDCPIPVLSIPDFCPGIHHWDAG